MAVTRLYTPRPYDTFDPGIAGVAPILATGTDVDNTKLTAVQAAATAAGLGTLPTSAGGTTPAPTSAPLRFRGPWQANTAYSYGDVVLVVDGSGNVLVYSANLNFTSGSSFNATNWTELTFAPNAAYLPVTPSNTPPANTAGLWLSNSLQDVLVSPDPADRVPVINPGAGTVAQEPQPLLVGGALVGVYYTTSGGQMKYAPITGDPTKAASYGAATTVLGQGTGGESGNAYHAGVYVEGTTVYLTYTDNTHINYATASTSAPATVTKQGVLLNLTDVGSPTFFGNSQIMKDGSTYYLDYDANWDNWQCGYATATSVTGPYTNVLSQGKLQSLWPGQPAAGGAYNGSPVGQGGNLHIIKENGVWVAFYHAGPHVSGSIPTDGYRATSTDRQAWTIDRGGFPFIRRAGAADVDQIADLRPFQINGNWYVMFDGYDNTANSAVIYCAPMAPVLKQADGFGGWQRISGPTDPTNGLQVPQRPASAFLTTDFTTTSVYAAYVTVLSCKFTPRTPRVLVVMKSAFAQATASNYAYFRITASGGSPVANGGMIGCLTCTNGGYNQAFSGDMEFTGLTPGVEYTFNVQVSVSAGTFYCRPATFPRQEAMSIMVQDAMYPPSRLVNQ